MSLRSLIWLTAVLALSALQTLAQEQDTSGPNKAELLFALKVKPIFAEKCLACHGDDPEDLGGSFDLRSLDSALRGGDSFGEEVLIPGKGELSQLYRVVAHLEEDYEMPPKLADRLGEAEAWAIRDWITAGAAWPSEDRVLELQRSYAEGEQVQTSKALSEDWQNRRYEQPKLWAYRPRQVVSIPEGEHPIDWFLGAKQKERGLSPAPDAAANVMARRLSFGLTGLPPTYEAIQRFTAKYERDPQKAVAEYGQQLMQSVHYGEHFAQHWLDVTRYADSAGFANDYARPHAWRYRDYVVQSFHADKPFDQFVKEQIAGDEMDATNPEYLIATGFLRMGPWEQTAMSVFKETRQLWLDDITDSVGQTFLAHAMQCAKCHDHKFDPVPTRDYYRMMAVFSTTQFADRRADFSQDVPRSAFKAIEDWTQKKIAGYEADAQQINQKIAALKKSESGDAKVGANGLDPGDEASQARIRKNIARHKIELDQTQPLAHSVYTGKTIPKSNVQGRITMPKGPWAKGYFDEDVIYTGGSVYSKGDPVVPGALSAAESLGGMEPIEFPAGKGKRRLALAEWIADPHNPLTARVIVNRVWSWHFGKGLAGNPNNFGGTGALPTHPQLHDYLAQRFVDEGWSIQNLNRLILSSAAYRRASTHRQPEKLAELDPKGELYATFQPRRLTAEELRDAMLAVSGELETSVGGVPARPDINPEVAVQPRQIMGGTASVYEPDPLPSQRNRRSLYTLKLRGLRDPFYETFNQPGLDDSCELRETSTVAPQALTLLNAQEVQDRALATAANILKESGLTDEQCIQRLFERGLGRLPTTLEQERCLAAWQEATHEERRLKYSSPSFPTAIERTVMAEKTGEPYTFTEQVPTYESYVPDLQPCNVDARTRGLAHVCLVVLNLNEFSYLD